ncbi:hypothetical protein XHV734_0601 [Xanthomonas hortorum pv. vitians]|nr:hypothetical protein XHV734_0601 [Xanthomonas hortorum pv. vitians]
MVLRIGVEAAWDQTPSLSKTPATYMICAAQLILAKKNVAKRSEFYFRFHPELYSRL